MMRRLFALLAAAVLLSPGKAGAQEAPAPVRIACVGNSITFGASLRNPAKDSYPAVLVQMLGSGYAVRNFGISGRTMLRTGDLPYMAESAYRQALEFAPDIVVIKLGTNDTKPQNWRGAEPFERDMQAMIDDFAALESHPRILLACPAAAYNTKGGIRDSVIVAEVIPCIRRVAERNGLETVDLHAATAGMEEHFPDKIHPDIEGQLALARALYRAITGRAIDFESQPFPGVRSRWQGYDRYDFDYGGRQAIVVTPRKALPGKPWIWRPAFFGAFPSVDLALLAEGYHVVYYDVTFLYGSPRSQELGDAFYEAMLKYYGLAPRVVVEGFSRGGMFAVNWAARRPERVACLYLDAPVCDVGSWPGRERREWGELLAEWRIDEARLVRFPGNPLDRLAPLAAAGVPIIGVSGDSDRTVPYDENLGVLKARYEELGGRIEVILKPGGDHHPHSLDDPAPIVGFILDACAR